MPAPSLSPLCLGPTLRTPPACSPSITSHFYVSPHTLMYTPQPLLCLPCSLIHPYKPSANLTMSTLHPCTSFTSSCTLLSVILPMHPHALFPNHIMSCFHSCNSCTPMKPSQASVTPHSCLLPHGSSHLSAYWPACKATQDLQVLASFPMDLETGLWKAIRKLPCLTMMGSS